MARIQPPPIYEPVVDDKAVATIPWTIFFNQLYVGDTGTPATGAGSWSPTFTNLTTVGTPTITGKIFKLSQSIAYFWVLIVPATSTSATAGTTYINNLPLDVLSDGACHAVSGLLGSSAGQVDAATNRIYVPAWSAVTVPLTVVGTIEAK